MQPIRLLIAAVVLAGLGGAIWWSNKQQPAAPDKAVPGEVTKTEDPATPAVIQIKEADVKQVEVEHADEPAVVAMHDTTWRITAPAALVADQGAVVGVIAPATNLRAARVLDDKGASNPANLAAYGLNPPLIAVKYTMKDGTSKRLRLGEDTPDGANTYAMVDGDSRLFTIASSQKSSFDKRATDLRERHLFQLDLEKLSKLELNIPGKPALEFGKTGETWQFLRPKPMRADGSAIDQLLSKLKDAQIEAPPPPARAPKGAKKPPVDPKQIEALATAGFAAGKPVGVVRLTIPDGVMSLEVRKKEMDYYARPSGVKAAQGTFKIAADLGDSLNKSLDDFRNKKLLDFGFDDPSRIEIKDKGQTRLIEKSGESWMSDARTMDSIAVQNLIDKLRDLAASHFDDPSPGANEIDITVVSKAKSGPRTEKLHVAPAGKDYVAVREGSPATYRLDAATVTGLREALNGVRQAESKDSKDKGAKGK